jgi:hypothetical protein
MQQKKHPQHANLLLAFQKLPPQYKREVLDFVGYLSSKPTSPTDEATAEILADSKMVNGIKKALQEVKSGKVKPVKF